MKVAKPLSGIAFTLLLCGRATAIDMCFSTTCSELVVVQGYKTPPKGKCRSIAAYEASTAVPYPGTGTICRNAIGDKLYATFTIPRLALGKTTLLTSTLSYPSLVGDAFRQNVLIGLSGLDCIGGTTAAPCSPAPLP